MHGRGLQVTYTLHLVMNRALRQGDLMHTLKPIHALMLCLLLGSPITLVAVEAYAGCCMCGSCSSGCTCPGVGRCAWCAAPGSKDLQVNSVFSDPSLDKTTVSEPVPSITISSYSLDRMIRRVGRGQCARNNFSLRVTDSIPPQNVDLLTNVNQKNFALQVAGDSGTQ